MSDRLEEIEKRASAAYPGSWFFNSYSAISSGTWVPAAYGDTAGPQDACNAEFIAEARSDIQWLIQEVKRLRGVHEATQQTLTTLTAERDHYGTEVGLIRAALRRLVELGNDDGSAPDDAWKQAWQEAAALVGRDLSVWSWSPRLSSSRSSDRLINGA